MADKQISLPILKEAYDAFTAEECDRIIEIGRSMEAQEGLVVSSEPDPLLDPSRARATRKLDARRSTVVFLERGDGRAEWIYQRMAQICLSLNEMFWNFSLKRGEIIQFATYEAGSYYHRHMDLGNRGPTTLRKLSIVVQLSDPADYEGGELELTSPLGLVQASRQRGSLLVFPSYAWHRVNTVSQGVRHSLAQWVRGEEPFR